MDMLDDRDLNWVGATGAGRPIVWPDWLLDGNARRLYEEDLRRMSRKPAGEEVDRFRVWRRRLLAVCRQRKISVRVMVEPVTERDGTEKLTLVVQAVPF